jgi:hypothetical protein
VSQRGEVLCGLRVRFSVQSPDEFNDVPSGIAFCKAMPEVFFRADHEGTWIVTAMHRAGAKKLIFPFFEVCAQALVVQYRLNGNGTFEILKIQKVREHC